jgi:predicted DNA-binding ribbon-helix-helix protein
LIRERAPSLVRKWKVRVGTHVTGVSMEKPFWDGLNEIARERELTLSNLLADINKHRRHANFSAVIRLFVLDHYRRLAEEKAKR